MSAEETTTADDDLIAPETWPIEIAGIRCQMRRVKTREFLMMLRLLVHGLGEALGQMIVRMAAIEDEQARSLELMGGLLVAIPEAPERFLELLRALVAVDPEIPDEMADDSDAIANYKVECARTVLAAMSNPELDDMTSILEGLVTVEGPQFAKLAGKVQKIGPRIPNMVAKIES